MVFLIENYSSKSFAENLMKLLTNKQIRMDFIERFENKFLKSYLNVYENISLFPFKNKNISLNNKIIERRFQSTVKQF